MKDYYKVLGIDKTATTEDIKKRYRELAKQYHPDVNPDEVSTEKFKEITEAYTVLSDETERRNYDLSGKTSNNFNFNFNMKDIFSKFYSDVFSQSTKCTDISIGISLTFEEGIFGSSNRVVNYSYNSICPECDGTGGKEFEDCKNCNGNGNVTFQTSNIRYTQTCNICHGSGKIIKKVCDNCRGKGYIQKQDSISIKLGPGLDNGNIVVIKGKGNECKGGNRGDLYLHINIQNNSKFKRDGLDIISDVSIPLSYVLFGKEIEIETVYGIEKYNIPKDSPVVFTIKLKNKGVKRKEQIGDHIVNFIVELPKNLDENKKEILDQLIN